jgi:hypothetical protein
MAPNEQVREGIKQLSEELLEPSTPPANPHQASVASSSAGSSVRLSTSPTRIWSGPPPLLRMMTMRRAVVKGKARKETHAWIVQGMKNYARHLPPLIYRHKTTQ